MTGRALPLAGITVVDLGQIYNGSYATFLMAMAGADVIKVEPLNGEPLRRRGAVGEILLPFALLNANKRAVTLNLKHERGRDILKTMVRRADVMLENFAPDAMERLGLGAEVMMAENARLIYASGSGYGRSGPDKDNLAMDLTVQAASGIMSVTGMAGGPPLKAGAAVCDFMGGVHLYAAVATALYERERTGRGRLVEVAMQEAVLPALGSSLGAMLQQGGAAPPRTGNRHGGLSIAPYNVYPAKDGHVAIITVQERHWQNILTCIGREDLKGDPRFEDNVSRAAHMEEVDALMTAWTSSLPRDEVVKRARAHAIACAPVRDLVEVNDDPHMLERGMLRRFDHPELGAVTLQTSPLRYHGSEPPELTASPALGQHNDEVYGGWLGLDGAEIESLRADGVI